MNQEDELYKVGKGDIYSDREEGQSTRSQHSLHKLEPREVQVSVWWKKMCLSFRPGVIGLN